MSKDFDEPTQPKAVFGVTVIVPVMVLNVGFCAMNDAILPVPLAARPINGLLLTQLYVVPATAPVKLTGVVAWPAHTVWLAIAFTTAVGLTVMLNVEGIPTQVEVPFTNDGVTVISAITGAAPVLVAINGSMFPLPVAGIPIEVALFVQL